MAERYIAFDVETPNGRNDRMSSIGLAVIEDGVITEEFSTLVDPETWFDRFNIRLTGITPAMAEQAPDFGELWPTLAGYLDSGILLAHNATFDLRVLACCLRAYSIDWYDTKQYLCTVRMGRRCYPALPDHRLDTLCAHCGVELDHHRADSDSHACAALFLDYLDQGLDPAPFLRTYDFNAMRTLRT